MIRRKGKLDEMAAQLALQRNFVTITPSAQITATSVPSNQSTTTLATSTTNGEIVTIAEAANQVTVTEASTTPIHIMQTHTQVYHVRIFAKIAIFQLTLITNYMPYTIHLLDLC